MKKEWEINHERILEIIKENDGEREWDRSKERKGEMKRMKKILKK